MDLLDMLNEPDEAPSATLVADSGEEGKEEPESKGKGDESQSQDTDEGAAWILGDSSKAGSTRIKGTEQSDAEVLANLRDTKIRDDITLDRLVWCKNNYFKKRGKGEVGPWFPARICDHKEGLMMKLNEWPIPDDQILVEFINAPKTEPACPRMFLEKRADSMPFNESVWRNRKFKSGGSSGTAKQTTLFESGNIAAASSSGERWHPDGRANVGDFLASYYSRAKKARLITDSIMKKAHAYLQRAVDNDREEEEGGAGCDSPSDAPSTQDQDQGEESDNNNDNNEEEENLAALIGSEGSSEKDKSKGKGKKVSLRAGDWVSYIHPIFSKVMFTRVVEVKPERDARGMTVKQRLVVENGEIFSANDDIRRMTTVASGPNMGECDKAEGSPYIKICDFKLKEGKSKHLKSIHEAGHAMAKGNKLRDTKKQKSSSSSSSNKGDDGKEKRKTPLKVEFIDNSQESEEEVGSDTGENADTGTSGVDAQTPLSSASPSQQSQHTADSRASSNGSRKRGLSIDSLDSSDDEERKRKRALLELDEDV
jgi:hypothetical protein